MVRTAERMAKLCWGQMVVDGVRLLLQSLPQAVSTVRGSGACILSLLSILRALNFTWVLKLNSRRPAAFCKAASWCRAGIKTPVPSLHNLFCRRLSPCAALVLLCAALSSLFARCPCCLPSLRAALKLLLPFLFP